MKGNAVAVFGSSQTLVGSEDWLAAEQVGGTLAGAGLAVITGGYSGTMEAASKGALQSGGHTIGVTAPGLFTGRPGANEFVAEEIEARTLSERIGIMMEMARGVIALPGSIGTATELLMAWNTNHIVRRNSGSRLPTVAVGREWQMVADTLVTEVAAFAGDIHTVDTAEQATSWILSELEIHRR